MGSQIGAEPNEVGEREGGDGVGISLLTGDSGGTASGGLGSFPEPGHLSPTGP